MPMNTFTMRQLLSFGLLALLCVPAVTGAPDGTALLRFLVIDGWGTPVTGDAQITLASVGTPTVSAKSLDYADKEDLRVPLGEYTVTVVARGFVKTSDRLVVDRDDQFVPLVLTLSPIEGRGVTSVPVSGTLGDRYKDESGPVWVRIVGVYANADRVAEVTGGGLFTFGRLQPGRYVVFIFIRGELLNKQEVEIHAFVPAKLKIE